MQAAKRVRVKVCCIRSVEEAEIAVRHGAAAIGLVSRMPSGPGVIDEAQIARIVARVPPAVATFLLTSETDPAVVASQQRRTGAGTLQLVDRMPAGAHRALREALPGVRIVQVVHVAGPASFDEALSLAPEVDALLLDSGNQGLAVKELGGTGRVHDWAISRRIRDAAPVPVFLAGGLHPGNVAEAIRAVGPFAVDVCSGLRSNDALDDRKVEAFFRALGEI